MTPVPEIELSNRSCEFEDEGMIVRVDIFRSVGSEEPWAMQVTSCDNDVTVWEEVFLTDDEAWEEFLTTVDRDGIGYFLTLEDSDTLH